MINPTAPHLSNCSSMERWRPVTTAPFDQDLELAVLERGDAHALVFPCRRAEDGWTNAQSGRRVEVNPTHWREWSNGQRRAVSF